MHYEIKRWAINLFDICVDDQTERILAETARLLIGSAATQQMVSVAYLYGEGHAASGWIPAAGGSQRTIGFRRWPGRYTFFRHALVVDLPIACRLTVSLV